MQGNISQMAIKQTTGSVLAPVVLAQLSPQQLAALSPQQIAAFMAKPVTAPELWFGYTTQNVIVAAQGKSGLGIIQMQGDYPFKVYSLSILITDAAAVGTAILPANSTATVQIQDTGAGANWFSGAVGVSSIFGTAQLPKQLEVVRVASKIAALQVTITNGVDGSTAAGCNYTVLFSGVKVGAPGGQVGLLGG